MRTTLPIASGWWRDKNERAVYLQYLGSVISRDGDVMDDIMARIAKACRVLAVCEAQFLETLLSLYYNQENSVQGNSVGSAVLW